MSRHDDESYGRHSRAHASGPWATDLIQRLLAAGAPLRLAWNGEETDAHPAERVEFPTAELPVIRENEHQVVKPTRETRKWFEPPGTSSWLQPTG